MIWPSVPSGDDPALQRKPSASSSQCPASVNLATDAREAYKPGDAHRERPLSGSIALRVVRAGQRPARLTARPVHSPEMSIRRNSNYISSGLYLARGVGDRAS